MKKLFVVFMFSLLAFGFAQTILIGNAERSYQVHLPSNYNSEQAYPMFVLLHGRNLTTSNMMTITNLNYYADQKGFIILYPQGKNKEWNYLGSTRGASDLEFIKQLVDFVSAEYSVDTKRIYLAGFSNGGFMAQRLICEPEPVFAAFASVSAQVFRELPAFCPKPQNTSIVFIHGTEDHILPFNGQVKYGRTLLPSVTTSYEYWLKAMSCSSEIDSKDLESVDEETRVVLFESQDCSNNQEVDLYAVVNAGHNWPGHTGFIPTSIGGITTKDIDANKAIWEFFKRHTLAVDNN